MPFTKYYSEFAYIKMMEGTGNDKYNHSERECFQTNGKILFGIDTVLLCFEKKFLEE